MKNLIRIRPKLKISTRFRKRKGLLIFLIGTIFTLIILAVAGIYFIVIPAQRVFESVDNIMATIDSLKDDLEGKDLTHLDDSIISIRSELALIDKEVEKYDFLKDLSFTKGYYDNLQVIRKLSGQTQDLLIKSLPGLKNLLLSLGYKVDMSSEVESVQVVTANDEDGEQLAALVRELPQVIRLYGEIEPDILGMIDTFNTLNPDYIPAIGTSSMQEKIISVQKLTDDFPSISEQLKTTMSKLPDLLGSQSPVTYLVIFQNEKELRASGGLLSAYGIFKVDKGELVGDIKAVDMWDLENYVSYTLGIDMGYRNIYGQNVLMNNGCGSTYLRAQDAGIYPDLHLTMDMFKDYYDTARKYNPKKYPKYNHIVILNTFFASDIVSLVEPVKVKGHKKEITSKNLAKEIFSETSAKPMDTSIRKKFIGQVATTVKEEIIKLSAKDFPKVFQTLIRTVQAKNIAFYSKNGGMQSYFDQLGISGRIEKNFSGDYFHLNEAQNCSLKANFYVTNTVTQSINIKKNNTIVKKIRVDWQNKKIYDPAEKYIISKNYRYPYRAWVRIFAPKGSNFTSSDGYSKSGWIGYQPQTYADGKMKKKVSDNVILFDHRRFTKDDPIRRHNLNVSYTLPKSLNYSEETGYRMLLQKHPGKRDEKYIINISHNGQTTSTTFRLNRDKVLTYKDGVIKVEDYDTRLDDYYDLFEQMKQL